MYKTDSERDAAVRIYAAGETSFVQLQRNGLENFLEVLQRLGELGLRLPIAALEGPNAELRARGRAIIAERILGA